jgi:dihydrodipicolinate synthase/N-acetylneuraminate lyase
MPAMLTPFGDGEAIDEDSLRYNIGVLHERGLNGFVVGGSTGQGPYLEPGEQTALAGAVRDVLGPDPFLMCGVFAETLRNASRQIAEAEEAGADAALVATPTALIRGRDHLVAGFFRDLASSSTLPILLYSVPKVTGYSLPVEVTLELGLLDGIVGIKDSGGDPERIAALAPLTENGFLAYAGTSRAAHASRAVGAHGAVTASGNYAAAMVSAALEDERAQAHLTAMTGVVESHGLAGTYVAAELCGLRPGIPRAPLAALDADAVAEIERSVSKAGFARVGGC